MARWRSLLLVGLLVGGSPGLLWAEPVTLEWSAVTTNSDQSPLTDLCCYKVYWGTSPGSHPNSVVVGNVTNTTIGGLNPALSYYFVVTALDTAEPPNESVVSVEVSARPSKVISW